MKESKLQKPESIIRRRDFMAFGAGALATMGILKVHSASGQTASAPVPSSERIPFWAAQPGKNGVGKPMAIDMHSHWSPAPYNDALAALGQPIAHPYPLDYEMDKRRQWMDEHGDLMHCLTLSGQMPWQRFSPKDGAHLGQVINDTGIQVHEKYPDRFTVGVELPISDYELALKELNRVAGHPGVRAVHLPDSIEKRDYVFDPGFAPVLARIQELDIPIIFHQMDGVVNTFGGSRTAGPPNLAAGIDAPIEHAFLASKLIYTGTLDKFPNLQMVLPHAGGAFPYLAGRVEHFLYHMNRSISIQHPFRDYLRRFHYDYLIYYPEALSFLIGLVGSDRIVVGTDNFAAKDVQYPTAVMDEFNLPASDRERILKGNAMRLLKLSKNA